MPIACTDPAAGLSDSARRGYEILPELIKQAAISQSRINGLIKRYSEFNFIFSLAISNEQMLFQFLLLEIQRHVWTILVESPTFSLFPPAITVMREQNGIIVDVSIADDLSPWLPANLEPKMILSSGA